MTQVTTTFSTCVRGAAPVTPIKPHLSRSNSLLSPTGLKAQVVNPAGGMIILWFLACLKLHDLKMDIPSNAPSLIVEFGYSKWFLSIVPAPSVA